MSGTTPGDPVEARIFEDRQDLLLLEAAAFENGGNLALRDQENSYKRLTRPGERRPRKARRGPLGWSPKQDAQAF